MNEFEKGSVLQPAMRKFADSLGFAGSHKHAKDYMRASEADPKLASFQDKAIQAGILANYGKVMDSDLGQKVTMSKDYGPYVMEVWPIVTAWYPEFPLKDLVSVQDMDKPLAYLFFSRLLTGTDKAPTQAGEVVETATGPRTIKGSYPTGEIYGETIPADQAEFDSGAVIALLNYHPLNLTGDYLSRVKFTVTGGALDGKTFKAMSVLNGEVVFADVATPTTDSGSRLNINTGLLSIAGLASVDFTSVSVNYVWNLDYANESNIPAVKEDIEVVPMEAQPRALAFRWTVFAEYLKQSQWGVDMRTDNTKRILNLLYHYQVRYILDRMYDEAEGGEVTINVTGAATMNSDVRSALVMEQLNQQATQIELNTGRMEGNRLMVGGNFKNFLESLPNTIYQQTPTDAAGYSAPREIGKYGKFVVFYDPTLPLDAGWMTYKGDAWYDAAAYLGMYMPMVATEAVALAVTVRQSFVDMWAFKFHKPKAVIRLKFAAV